MPFGPKWTAGISDHYSKAWAIALQLRVEACGSQWKPVEAVEVVRKQWKTCGRQGRSQKGCRRCRRDRKRSGRGPEGHGKVQKRWESTGSNSTLHQTTVCDFSSLKPKMHLAASTAELYHPLKGEGAGRRSPIQCRSLKNKFGAENNYRLEWRSKCYKSVSYDLQTPQLVPLKSHPFFLFQGYYSTINHILLKYQSSILSK